MKYVITVTRTPGPSPRDTGFVGRISIEAESWDAAVADLAGQLERRPSPPQDSCRFENCTSLPGFCKTPE